MQRNLLAQGIDPSEQKRETKVVAAAIAREQPAIFEVLAREWYAKKTAHLTLDHQKQIISRFENIVFPILATSLLPL